MYVLLYTYSQKTSISFYFFKFIDGSKIYMYYQQIDLLFYNDNPTDTIQ